VRTRRSNAWAASPTRRGSAASTPGRGSTTEGTTTTEATRRPLGVSRGAAALVALFGALVLLGAGCQDEQEKRPPGQEDVDRISASVAGIVFNCRSVDQGFLASADEEALRRDVDALTGAAEEIDPDASFRLPESTLERKTTLRDQVDLAARTLEADCSPDDAERLRDALGD
jgi:hypothetical protein